MLIDLFENSVLRRVKGYWFNANTGLVQVPSHLHHTQFAIDHFDIDGDETEDFDPEVLTQMVAMDWVRISVDPVKKDYFFQGTKLKVRRAISHMINDIALETKVVIDFMSKTGEYLDHLILDNIEDITKFYRKGIVPRRFLEKENSEYKYYSVETDVSRYNDMNIFVDSNASEVKFWYNYKTKELVVFPYNLKRVHHTTVLHLLNDNYPMVTDRIYDNDFILTALEDGWVRGHGQDHGRAGMTLTANGHTIGLRSLIRGINQKVVVGTAFIETPLDGRAEGLGTDMTLRGNQIETYIKTGQKSSSRMAAMRESVLIEKVDAQGLKQKYMVGVIGTFTGDKHFKDSRFLKNRYGDISGQDFTIKENSEALFDKILEIFIESDPTRGKFVPWMILNYINTSDYYLEDIVTRISTCLDLFVKAKQRGYFKLMDQFTKDYPKMEGYDDALKDHLHDYYTTYKLGVDITKLNFKWLEQFCDMYNDYIDIVGHSRTQDNKRIKEGLLKNGEADILHDGDDSTIIEVVSFPAMVFFARPSRWCVASETKGKEVYDDYINGDRYKKENPRFIICLDKDSKNKYLLYFFNNYMDYDEQVNNLASGGEYDDEDGDTDYDRVQSEVLSEFQYESLDEDGYVKEFELRDGKDDKVLDSKKLPYTFKSMFEDEISRAIHHMKH